MRMLQPLIARVKERLGSVVYAVEDTEQGSLARCAVEALRRRGWTAAAAESLTGGMIASALVDVPGASRVLKGAMVTYQEETKTLLAGVPAEMIDRYGVVSEPVAGAMAEGARARLDTDIAVSATGLAGPDGGTEETPVGTVFIGVATRERTRVIPLRLAGSRMRIRTLAMKHALHALWVEATGEVCP